MNPPPASTEGIHRHNFSVKIQEAKIAKMVKFTTEELQRIMNKKHNIRNVSVIGQLDHGKSKLIDSVVAAVRIIGEEVDTDISVMDTCANKTEHCITVKSTGISLYYKMTDQSLRTFKGERDGNEYLINLIDTPGHVDFSSEVTAALRITDGALVLIDCVEGVCVQTETVLCQAHAEMVRPVLALNKIDRFFMDLNLDGEEMYQQLSWIINNANEHMTKYGDDVKFCPVKGTVAFSAGVHGWAFTLTNFAKIFAPTFDFDEYKMAEKLWGENFYDASTKEWSTENTGSATCIRGFVMFCYQPIKHVITLCMAGKKDEVCSYLEGINVTIKNDEELMGKALEKYVLQTWLPASTALLQMMIFDLPSPSTAQKYRVSNLYKGPLEDKYATAISNCDPEGPLILYVSKMIPASVKGRFFALGRVFSGRVTTGMKVRIMGPNYVPGLKKDVYVQTVQHAVIWTPNKHELVNDAPAGNIVAVVGLDQFITKNATLTNGEEFDAYPFRAMKFSVSPILLVAVQCKVASDFPKLVEGLRCLVKSDPIVRCTIEESGEHVIAGTGELHLKVCLKDLQGYFMDGVEITSSTPAVSFRETVLEKSCRVMIESPNKHNCLHMQAYPLATELTKAIDEGYIKPGDEHEAYTKMVHEFDLNVDLTRKVWCFGPDMNGPNMVFDMCKGVPYLNDIKDSIVAGFQWASKEGSLAEESMRGIGFGICGAVLHADAINRVNGQVIPMVKRAIYASQLRAKPRLVEPVYLVEIQAPEHSLGIIYGVLRQVRGEVFDVIQRTGTPLYNIRAYVPPCQ